MFTSLTIKNFKSIPSLEAELGRVTVLIGENGSGKSNVLEAIAFAAAAANDKLDHEFLASRGIRVAEPRFMRAAFEESPSAEISVRLGGAGNLPYQMAHEPRGAAGTWQRVGSFAVSPKELQASLQKAIEEGRPQMPAWFHKILARTARELDGPPWDFLIYSPENSALRTFQAEGQILPLGIRGEGLFALLKALGTDDAGRATLAKLSEELTLLDWFGGFHTPEGTAPGERTLLITDRHLSGDHRFDQRSANEGFLFLLFYFALLLSPETPAFFAIDNVDASLNPKLCAELTRRIIRLAKENGKQVILTTHNPAVLDGLDLGDEEQRLLAVYRNRQGHTKVRRVLKPEPVEGVAPVRLSEAFLRGYIGGLPKNF